MRDQAMSGAVMTVLIAVGAPASVSAQQTDSTSAGQADDDSRARYVATIASLGATWTLAPGWSSTAVVAYAQPSSFLRETGADDVLSFISLSLQYRF